MGSIEKDADDHDCSSSVDLLHTKYYCQVTNGKAKEFGEPTLDAVMELWTEDMPTNRRIPQRYVLVIDVSNSMSAPTSYGDGSLLDRVKTFAELVITTIKGEDSLAIVTFSNDALVELPLTLMTEDAKQMARNVVTYLETKESTNLESGLMTGLDEIAKNPCPNSRDCIILFTDGETNTGEQDVEIIVNNYKQAQENMNRSTCVPVSAFTIGQYLPVLLAELADFLGSEAFYWLNEEEDFESDMLIPIFLRESTQVTDVTIEFTCLHNFTFESDALSKKHLKESSLSKLKYFIHAIPVGVRKHIPLTIIPPERDLLNLEGEQVVEVNIEYANEDAKIRETKDFISFSVFSLRECRMGEKREKGIAYSDISNGISAYIVEGGKINASWEAAQCALETVVNEDCRELSLREMDDILYHLLDEEGQLMVGTFEQTVSNVENIKKTYRKIFSHKNQCTTRIDACADGWIEKLNFGKSLANPYNYGRIAALQSSFAAEMPVAKGVYSGTQKQLYMPENIQKKLRECEKVVKKAKKRENFGTSSVFENQTMVVSESLRAKKVGSKRETFAEIIIRCGGRPDYYVIVNPYDKMPNWYVPKSFSNYFLVCSKKDHANNSQSVRDAKKAHIPIVTTHFLFDCIRRKKFLKMESYFFNFP